MTAALAIARQELRLARRNLLLAIATGLMAVFAVVLGLAGAAPAGVLGADRLSLTVASLTTLSVYLVPLLALLLAFDAIAGERERGTLALTLAYPVRRAALLAGKFAAHLLALALALAVGLALALAVAATLGEISGGSLAALGRLWASGLALGAAFLGLGYALSGLARLPAAAAGLAIGLWLTGVVLWDLGLLGALVADDGGQFTKQIFPWLLAANPADAFRLINLPPAETALLAGGLGAAGGALAPWVPMATLLAWPVLALAAAWTVLKRLEP